LKLLLIIKIKGKNKIILNLSVEVIINCKYVS